MKLTSLILIALLFASQASAGWVNGYYRKDGTYVEGHYRSDPDGQKWNNYGKKPGGSGSYDSPWTRDYDGDGSPNIYDFDDDNDGISDNYDN